MTPHPFRFGDRTARDGVAAEREEGWPCDFDDLMAETADEPTPGFEFEPVFPLARAEGIGPERSVGSEDDIAEARLPAVCTSREGHSNSFILARSAGRSVA